MASQPKLVRLGPPGLYSLPTVEGSGGLILEEGQLPIRIHLALEDETQLHLPMTKIAVERVYGVLKVLFDPPERIPGRPDADYTISDAPTFLWDDEGTTLSACFFDEKGKGTATVQMPAAVVGLLRDAIEEAILRRPQAELKRR